jgi:hypothetical protein
MQLSPFPCALPSGDYNRYTPTHILLHEELIHNYFISFISSGGSVYLATLLRVGKVMVDLIIYTSEPSERTSSRSVPAPSWNVPTTRNPVKKKVLRHRDAIAALSSRAVECPLLTI